MIGPQRKTSPVMRYCRPSGTVRLSSEVMKISARSSSFQAPVKVKIATATSPGADSGSRTRTSAPIRVAPSTIACSSRSAGMPRK